MSKVVHFDIYADDPERAIQFYSQAFGWEFKKWEGEGMEYWLITAGMENEMGINGGMSKREGFSLGRKVEGAITIGVSNIDEAISKVKGAGGKITMDKAVIPQVGWFANFRDPEGNELGIIEMDKTVE